MSYREGEGFANSVEPLGVDLRTRPERSGAKEKARRRRCDVRFSFVRWNWVFQKSFLRIGVRKLLRMGLVPARVRGGQAVGSAPTEGLKLRKQVAATAGNKESVSLSLFMDGYALLGRRCVDEQMVKGAAEGVKEADL